MNLFKIHSSKGTREISIPQSWGKLTTDQFQKLATDWNGEDLIKLFSILSGIEYKTLENTHDIILEEQLLASTKFIYNDAMDFKDAAPPNWININGKQVRIPVKIGALSIGQNIHVRQELDKAKVTEGLIAYVCAIYLQPLVDDTEFDYYRAMELEQDILKLPIEKTYPLAVFFLRKLNPHGGSIIDRLQFLITRLLVAFTKRETI